MNLFGTFDCANRNRRQTEKGVMTARTIHDNSRSIALMFIVVVVAAAAAIQVIEAVAAAVIVVMVVVVSY